MASKTKVIIIFPYSGFEEKSEAETAFWSIVEWCKIVDMDSKPLVVVNRDTEIRQKTVAFTKKNNGIVDTISVWSVDTCQMWLAGWGYVIDNFSKAERICQIPGDLTTIVDKANFKGKLDNMMTHTMTDFVLGTFDTGDPLSAKELIDTYGTKPLLANWFPEVSKELQKLSPRLTKMRTEFLNINISTLKELIKYRKFAYEQTLNMLLRSWDHENENWKYIIRVFELGTLKDDTSFRSFRGCVDQVERTERMLKMIWREVKEPAATKNNKSEEEIKSAEKLYRKFTDNFELLDRRSRSIRENARISIRAFLVPTEDL